MDNGAVRDHLLGMELEQRRHPSSRHVRRGRAAICGVLPLVAACDSPTTPSIDLNGAWDFTFSAFDQRSCPVPAGLMRGCAGSGRLEFLATSPVDATHSYRASCQSCGGAAEYGVAGQPLRMVRLAGDALEFTLAACHFTTAVPGVPAQTLVGTVVCRPEPSGPEIGGSWMMSRR